ncbi:MAG: LysR family transcriptional regulator [Burkholderiaceae bacterium]|jgi:LysR family transcriptional regulator for bpeEF and oprC
MDKLHAMEVFVRVVDAGAFTRAAAQMRIPKATATTLIQALEASLGVKLLNRTTRRLALTPDGAAYYERCVELLSDLREIEEALTHTHASAQGRVRVEVSSLMARLVIIPALPRFFSLYPQIQLELGCSDRPVDLIEEGVDCAVWSGELADSSLVARRVGMVHVATCAAPSYLARHGRPQHPRDLASHQCINFFSPKTGKTVDWDFSKDGVRIQETLRGPLSINDANGYLAAAQAGLGVAQIPAFVLKDSMDQDLLEPVLGEWFSDPVPLQVVYPQRQHLSNKVRVFVDWIAELFAEHDAIQLRSLIGAAKG